MTHPLQSGAGERAAAVSRRADELFSDYRRDIQERTDRLFVGLMRDLILMDLGLPVMDGWEATRQLKDDVSTRHMPIIVLSAHAMTTDRELALSAGGDEFDTKPVRFPQLLQEIEFLLARGAVAR